MDQLPLDSEGQIRTPSRADRAAGNYSPDGRPATSIVLEPNERAMTTTEKIPRQTPSYSRGPLEDRSTATQERYSGGGRPGYTPDRGVEASPARRTPDREAYRRASEDPASRDRLADRGRFGSAGEAPRELDIRALMLMIEVDRLGSLLTTLTNENTNLANDKRAMQGTIDSQNEQIRDLNERLKRAKEGLEILQSDTKKESSDKDKWYKKEKSTLEEQVKNHQLKQSDLENKLLSQLAEIERLKNLINTQERDIRDLTQDKDILLTELSDLQKKIEELESKRKMELAEQRLQLEDEKNKAIRTETTRLKDQHKEEIQRMEEELANQKAKLPPLEKKIKSLNDQVDQQNNKIKQLEEQVEDLNSQLTMTEDQRNQLKITMERRLKESAAELERVSDENLQLKKELESLRIKLDQEDRLHKQQKKDLEDERARGFLIIERLKSRGAEIDLRSVMVMAELDRQLQLNQQKDIQIASLEQKLVAAEKQHELDVEELKKHHDEVLDEVVNKQQGDHEKEKEKMRLDNLKLVELEKIALEKILKAQFDDQLDQLHDAHQREQNEANAEIDDLRRRIAELEDLLEQRDILIDRMKAEHEQALDEIDHQMRLVEDLRKENSILKTRIDTISSEVSKLVREKTGLEKELDNNEAKIRELNATIIELQKKITELMRDRAAFEAKQRLHSATEPSRSSL